MALFTSADPTLSGPAVRALPLCFPIAKNRYPTLLNRFLNASKNPQLSELCFICVTCVWALHAASQLRTAGSGCRHRQIRHIDIAIHIAVFKLHRQTWSTLPVCHQTAFHVFVQSIIMSAEQRADSVRKVNHLGPLIAPLASYKLLQASWRDPRHHLALRLALRRP